VFASPQACGQLLSASGEERKINDCINILKILSPLAEKAVAKRQIEADCKYKFMGIQRHEVHKRKRVAKSYPLFRLSKAPAAQGGSGSRELSSKLIIF